MVKKDFTEGMPKSYDQKADVDLIEDLGGTTIGQNERDVIKAILEKRLKRVIQDSGEKSDRASRKLEILTWVLTLLTAILVLAELKVLEKIHF